MIATAHIIVGAAVGEYAAAHIPGPLGLILALFTGIISHHLLDLILHTDQGSWHEKGDISLMSRREAVIGLIDNIVGTVTVLVIFFFHPDPSMLFGAAGGNFPDVFHHPPLWAEKTRKLFHGIYFKFHRTYHWTARGFLIPVGIFTELFAIIFGLVFLVYGM